MTKFLEDNISVTMKIGGQTWLLSEGKAVLSRNIVPNFVRIKKMAPGPETTFSNVNDLLGQDFSLSVDSGLTQFRNSPGEFSSTIFNGKVANITSRGTGVYEAIVYDPSQQILNETEQGGSLMNREIEIKTPEKGLNEIQSGNAPYSSVSSTTQFTPDVITKKASTLLTEVLDEVGITDREIQLKQGGKEVGGPRGSFIGAKDVQVTLDEKKQTVKNVLQKIRNKTKSFWWFDRTGTFYFGVPDANVHNPELITNNSSGVTTPPYQSIVVIGSDVASSKGYGSAKQNPDEPIVVGGNIILGESSEPQLNQQSLQYGDINGLVEPTFTHKSREIITEEQAQNTLETIAQDLGEQYASGSLTTVGFPEPEIFDVMILPHANEQKKGKGNFNPRQPMGGSIFSVYKIQHMFNPSDGYKTKFELAGMTGPASVLVDPNKFVKDPASEYIPPGSDDTGAAGVGADPVAQEDAESSTLDGFESEERISNITSEDSSGGVGL